MRVMFGASQIAPSKNFSRLQQHAIEKGLEFNGKRCRFFMLPNGPKGEVADWDETDYAMIDMCDIGAVGVGAFQKERVTENALAARFKQKGKPLVVFGDMPESTRRFEADGAVINTASTIYLPTKAVLAEAKELGWQNPQYIGLPPSYLIEYQTLVSKPPQKAFMKQAGESGSPEDIVDGDKVLFFPGTGSPEKDVEKVKVLCQLGKNYYGSHAIVGYRPHPGKLASRSKNQDLDEAFCAIEEALLDAPNWLRFDQSNVTQDQQIALVKAQGGVTITGGMSTICLPIALSKTNAVWAGDEADLERNRTQGAAEDGLPFVVRMGGLHHAKHDLAQTVCYALSDEGAQELREAQETHFPEPANDDFMFNQRFFEDLAQISQAA